MHVYLEYLERVKPPVILTLKVPIYLTEDVDRVQKKILELFPWIPRLSHESTRNDILWLTHQSHDEQHEYKGVKSLFRQFVMAQILDSARAHFIRKWKPPRFHVMFHKQAAMVNRLSFCDDVHESPLGTISLTIETTEPDVILNGMTPRWDWIKPGGTPLPPDSPHVSMYAPKHVIFDDAKKK